MAQQKKNIFILPIIIKMPNEKLPPMLSQYNYLDFSDSKQYNSNLTKLIQRIKLDKSDFTGIKYYKNIDISPLGFVYGVGEIDHISPTGYCVRFHYENGFPVRLDLLKNQKIDLYKLVYYENYKVVKKEIYQENKLISKLLYFYTKEGIRNRKQIFGTGTFPESEIEYDALDRRTREKYFNAEGKLDDSNGFAIKEYLYDKSRKKVGETIYNSEGEIVNQNI